MRKRTDELEFLPAVLEIQETPPLPFAHWILWAILLLFAIGVVWAWFGHVDIVGVAIGKIVPTDRVKIIQPLESGTIRAIHVTENEKVKRGQILVELDPTLTGADRESLREQLMALQLDRVRLLTVLKELESDKFEFDHVSNLQFDYHLQASRSRRTVPEEVTPEQLRILNQRIQSQLNQYRARQRSLEERENEKRAERRAVIQRIQQLNGTIPLITERTESLRILVEEDMAPRMQWLALEQERIEQVEGREVQHHNLEMLDAAIEEIIQRQEELEADFESRILGELVEVKSRIATMRQEWIKAEKRVSRRRLVAPVSGQVYQLAVHTIGGVVTPAQELMRIVPSVGAVEVEAWVPNKDIGFVHEGQETKIKVQTFPFTKYGTIQGKILNISDDATQDENLGLVYAARVNMEKAIMEVEDKIVNLTPGMAVTVEINMGKRRLIEFLLSPLLRYKDESLRER